MTDAEQVARGILATCRMGSSPTMSSLSRHSSMTRSVVFGTAAESLDGQQSRDYIARMIAQDGTVRWSWDRVVPVMFETTILSFAVLGTVGFEDTQGRPLGVRQPFRLTCFAVVRDGKWRLRHFHGSIPHS